MFRLHDVTRRRICRGVFLAAAVAPTLAVIGWVAVEHRPGRTAACERSLRQDLRLAVTLDDVRRPRPHHTLLTGVKITDPESGDTLLTCPEIEIVRQADRVVLVASPMDVAAGRLGLLADVVRRRMRDIADGGEPDVRFVAHAITINSGNRRQTFTDVVGKIERSDDEVRTNLQFRIAGDGAAELGRMSLHLGHAAAVELHTGGASIPLPPLAALWPAVANLGDTAEFRGAVWAHEEPNGWRGEASGELTQIDLNRLVTERFPHKLSGIARVAIDRAKFHDSRLTQAVLRVESDAGQIEDSLLTSAESHLGLIRRTPTSSARYHPYTKLRLWAELGEGTLTLRAADGETAILADASGPLLHESSAGPQPIVNVVRALVPTREVWVPASAETESLLPRLPLPAARPANPDNTPPRTRLRPL
jgi:hypothetical protein